MGALTRSPVWKRSTSVAWVQSQDRVVVLSLIHPGSSPLALQGSAGAIWNAINGESTVEEIVAAVAYEFDLRASEITVSIVEFLEQLAGLGFIDHADVEPLLIESEL